MSWVGEMKPVKCAGDDRSQPSPKTSQSIVDRIRNAKSAILIVGGVRYEASWSAFEKFPGSRLGQLRHATSIDVVSQFCDDFRVIGGVHSQENNVEYVELIFFRNAQSFSAVLTFYQTGELHIVDGNCVMSFSKDLEYWGIDEQYLADCCQHRYHEQKESVLEQKRKDAASLRQKALDEDFGIGCLSRLRRLAWDLLEHPQSSVLARIFELVSIFIILVSLVVLALRSDDLSPLFALILTIVELGCLLWFTVEYLARFVASPGKLRFLLDPFNVIDLLATVAFCGKIVMTLFSLTTEGWRLHMYYAFASVHTLRMLRLLKLGRHSTAIRSLGVTLQQSGKEFGLLAMFFAVGVVIFSYLAFFAEGQSEYSSFSSIPRASWFAIVTMTTVGYGDMYPTTIFGKFVAATCCIYGIVVFVLHVPIFVNSYTRVYQEQKRHDTVVKRRSLMKIGLGTPAYPQQLH